MNLFRIIIFILPGLLEEVHAQTGDVVGVFVGTSPCAEYAKPMLSIPTGTPCDWIKWHLRVDNNPARYQLTREYGYYVDNRTSTSKGTIILEGKWTVTKGTRYDPGAIVYSLHSATDGKTLLFLKATEKILHLLNQDRSLMVGDGGQSYTLSKTPGK